MDNRHTGHNSTFNKRKVLCIWQYGPLGNGHMLQKEKTEMVVSVNQKNTLMTMLKQNSSQ